VAIFVLIGIVAAVDTRQGLGLWLVKFGLILGQSASEIAV
jgi:hypothetical protein